MRQELAGVALMRFNPRPASGAKGVNSAVQCISNQVSIRAPRAGRKRDAGTVDRKHGTSFNPRPASGAKVHGLDLSQPRWVFQSAPRERGERL